MFKKGMGKCIFSKTDLLKVKESEAAKKFLTLVVNLRTVPRTVAIRNLGAFSLLASKLQAICKFPLKRLMRSDTISLQIPSVEKLTDLKSGGLILNLH